MLFPPVIFGGSVWVHAWAASSKGTVSSVPAWFRADSGTNLIKHGEIVTGRLCGSVAQWSECLHGMRKVLGSSPGRAMCYCAFFLSCYIWWLSVGPCSGCEQQRDCSLVPAWFRADSETNLIKQGEIVTGRLCGSVTQWSECLHGMREVLGLSPSRAMCSFLPLYLVAQCGSMLWLRAAKGLFRRFRHGSEQIQGRILIKHGEIVTGRLCGSVAQWSECLHCMRKVLGSSPGRAMCYCAFFLSCYIWWLSVGPCSGCEQQRDCSLVSAWFRADSETNLIKQGEIVTGRLCGSVTQWSECLHGM